VSTAVPKKITYSVREAWRTHAEPIQPPALTKIHCRSEAGKMCPGYFALRSLCTFWNAFFTSNGAVVSAFQNTMIKITRIFQYYTQLIYQHHININNKLIQPRDHDNKLAKYRDLKILVTGHSMSLQIAPFDRLPMRRFIVTMALSCIISEIKQDTGQNHNFFFILWCKTRLVFTLRGAMVKLLF